MAITVTKEKNIISILVEGKTAPYKFDINTGIMYGLRGKAIKNVTAEVYRGLVPFCNKTEVAEVIADITDGQASKMGALAQYADILRIADSFDNLGISLGNSWRITRHYNDLAKNKSLCKDYIKYAIEQKEKHNSYSFETFLEKRKIAAARKKFDFDIDAPKYDVVRSYLLDIAYWATPRQIKSYCVNFIYNDAFLAFNRYALNQFFCAFKKYCEYCGYINEKVTTKDNFLSEFGRVNKAYLRQKEEIDAARFKKAMGIHRAEMEFEYGDFKVVIPTTPQEIKDEGLNMHHCVASYAYTCMKTDNPSRAHIVFVRHKDTPEKCYITCEIVNGKIKQYFLSHDRHITSEEDKQFKSQYQAHLNRTWVKE